VVNTTYPDSEVVSHTYNSQGLLETLSSTTYATNYISNLNYNALDKVTGKAAGNGKNTYYTYDPSNFRLTGLSTSGLQNLTYAYDNVGNITAITDSLKAGSQSFGYDDLDRLTSASGGAVPSFDHTYAYNAIGNVTTTGSRSWGSTVESSSYPFSTSLKLDNQGNPHISYSSTGAGHLKYAKWTGSSWDIQTVESAAGAGNTSLALDSQGNPHISYTAWNSTTASYNLKYARWTGSSWDIQTIDSSDGGNTSLAMDSQGNSHISYYSSNSLKYAKWNGTNWTIQVVAAGAVGVDQAGQYSSLALNSAEDPRIAYYYYSAAVNGLRYAKWTGDAWEIETVDNATAGVLGWYPSLALDSGDRPHISYYDNYYGALKYARKWTTTSWKRETVESGYTGLSTSLALDSQGNPRISYQDTYGGDSGLKHARWTGSSWNIETIDSNGQSPISLALDSAGNPRISYSDATNLKYYGPSGSWSSAAFTYPAAGSKRPHAPTSDGTCSYSYDANGNMKTRTCGSTTRSFTWNADNRLTKVEDNGVTLATFTYDYAGARVKKVEGSNTTIYPFPWYKIVNGTAVTKYYFANGQRIAERVGPASTDVSFYFPDHLGSSNYVVGGGVFKRTLFYPYGSTRSETGTKEIAHKFTGKELDSSVGLYRTYDPGFQHYIKPTGGAKVGDPQSLNRYALYQNNPLKMWGWSLVPFVHCTIADPYVRPYFPEIKGPISWASICPTAEVLTIRFFTDVLLNPSPVVHEKYYNFVYRTAAQVVGGFAPLPDIFQAAGQVAYVPLAAKAALGEIDSLSTKAGQVKKWWAGSPGIARKTAGGIYFMSGVYMISNPVIAVGAFTNARNPDASMFSRISAAGTGLEAVFYTGGHAAVWAGRITPAAWGGRLASGARILNTIGLGFGVVAVIPAAIEETGEWVWPYPLNDIDDELEMQKVSYRMKRLHDIETGAWRPVE
jgi:RHS repeat-associated protein